MTCFRLSYVPRVTFVFNTPVFFSGLGPRRGSAGLEDDRPGARFPGSFVSLGFRDRFLFRVFVRSTAKRDVESTSAGKESRSRRDRDVVDSTW